MPLKQAKVSHLRMLLLLDNDSRWLCSGKVSLRPCHPAQAFSPSSGHPPPCGHIPIITFFRPYLNNCVFCFPSRLKAPMGSPGDFLNDLCFTQQWNSKFCFAFFFFFKINYPYFSEARKLSENSEEECEPFHLGSSSLARTEWEEIQTSNTWKLARSFWRGEHLLRIVPHEEEGC